MGSGCRAQGSSHGKPEDQSKRSFGAGPVRADECFSAAAEEAAQSEGVPVFTDETTKSPVCRDLRADDGLELTLLDVAGLELEALFGSFDRDPLGDESREYVFVARR
jgi:hypothetical protein